MGIQNEDAGDLAKATKALFSVEIKDAQMQQRIMAYITTKVVQDLVEGLDLVTQSLQRMDSLNLWRLEVGANVMLSMATILPLVRNRDNTISMIRWPLVPLLRRHLIPFSEVVRLVAAKGQAGLVSNFRPWSRCPDHLHAYLGAVSPEAVWGMADDELDALLGWQVGRGSWPVVW